MQMMNKLLIWFYCLVCIFLNTKMLSRMIELETPFILLYLSSILTNGVFIYFLTRLIIKSSRIQDE